MSQEEYDRVTVGTTNESKGRIRGLLDSLQSLGQNVETVVRNSRFEISGGNVDQIDAPDDLDELVDLAKEVGFVWKAYQVFANEVWEPGYRLEGPDKTVAYFMGDTEDVDARPPEDTPEGGFLANSGVIAGEKRQPFYEVGKEATFQRRLRGTVLVELLKAEEENPESEITGFYFIRPETVSAEVYPNTNVLIDPEDTDQAGVVITKRGEAAAYIQFADDSILGRKGTFGEDTEEIPLSQNDVHKQTLNPGIGDDANSEQGVFGTSGLEPISEDISEYRKIKRDRANAIATKAYGIWSMEYGHEVLDLGDTKEIIEWDEDDMEADLNEIENLGPGDIAQHDGTKTLKKFDSDVPDLDDTLKHYVDDIFSGLPVSKFKVGFADDINRDVTSEQAEHDVNLVHEEREYQERQWTQVLKRVAERKGLPTDGLRLKIEPEPEDSPVMSLSTEEIEKLATYAEALNSLAGPQGGPQTLVDRETLLTDVAQLPENESLGEDLAQEVQDVDEESETLFRQMVGLDTLAQFEDAEVVDTPDGIGVIDDVITSGSVDGMDATGENPVYAVVVEDAQVGVGFYREDELSDASTGDLPGPENPEEDVKEEAETDTNALDVYQEGRFEWPQSWQDSETPARVIALKAWAGMEGSFDGCVREMRGNLSGSPNRFCADFKDRLLGTEEWRGGWTD